MRRLPGTAAAIVLCMGLRGLPAAEDAAAEQGLSNPFFALCVSTHDARYRTPDDQARLLEELGYAGNCHLWCEGVPDALKAVDDHGLKLFQIYIRASVDPNKPKYDPRLKEVIKLLKGRETIIGMLITGMPPSSVQGDPRAVEIVREIADMARESGVRVALYPHSGDWLERVEDAVRIVKKVDRKNVGVIFNLCHWLIIDDEKNLGPVLELAMPHLFVVTINGTRQDVSPSSREGWIQTLDRGSFDNFKLLKTLKELGYDGPIGLQCYGIQGDVRDNLARSMKAWREFSGRIAAEDDGAGKLPLAGRFFAFDNGTGRSRLRAEAQASMLKELGYAGIGYSETEGIPEMLKALDEQGLKMFSIYVGANVDPKRPKYDPRLGPAIKQLKGRETIIWLTIVGGKPSSAEADSRAVEIVREVAGLAKESGLRVALYPHVGFYVASVEDALRLVKKVDRENVGASFNLCHWLKLDDEKNMKSLLQRAMPHLFAVSINGADSGDTREMGWDLLIQTLDRGSFDNLKLLKMLSDLGYTGPIGLQCYGVQGDVRDNLERSMAAWRRFSARIAAQKD